MFIYFSNVCIYIFVSGGAYSNRGGATKGQTASNLCKDSLQWKGHWKHLKASQASCRPPYFFVVPVVPFSLSSTAIGWKGSIKESVCVCAPRALCRCNCGPTTGEPPRSLNDLLFRFLDAVDMVVIVGPSTDDWFIFRQWRLLNNRRAPRRWWQVSHLFVPLSSSSFYLRMLPWSL